jgi:hypothetical protein
MLYDTRAHIVSLMIVKVCNDYCMKQLVMLMSGSAFILRYILIYVDVFIAMNVLLTYSSVNELVF